MISIEVENIKKITNAIFASETFDSFCVIQASFQTLYSIDIDGHVNPDFLKDAEGRVPEGTPEVITWKQIRPLCFEALKGNRLPVRFKIVFMTPPEKIAGFISKNSLSADPESVNGLFMNIRFENGKLSCVTGVSLKTFTMDKSLENAWDGNVAAFMKNYQ